MAIIGTYSTARRADTGEVAMSQRTFQLEKEFVELHVLLKLLALAPSGGAAKAMIAAGHVSVDGVVETRKACKIRGNQVVSVGGDEIRVIG
jgi:ribosome-associated protein